MLKGCSKAARSEVTPAALHETSFSLKAEVRREARDVGVGQFGQGTEVVDGGKACALSAKIINRLRLAIAQVWVMLQTLYG